MSTKSHQIVTHIINKELNKAKTLIHESMNEKLGILLEEKLLEYAPTIMEGSEPKEEQIDWPSEEEQRRDKEREHLDDAKLRGAFSQDDEEDDSEVKAKFENDMINHHLGAIDKIMKGKNDKIDWPSEEDERQDKEREHLDDAKLRGAFSQDDDDEGASSPEEHDPEYYNR